MFCGREEQEDDLTKYEKFRAWVVGFKTEAPMPGMSPGTIMVVETGTQLIDVHICPTWFAKPGDIGVKKGDRVKIKGCRAEIDQKEVFMAAKDRSQTGSRFSSGAARLISLISGLQRDVVPLVKRPPL